ncbi:MAG: hypothetical protein BJ554DRAFT_310 [Olpidium bornovanus]|uniref:Uncharacterized protein n=1 Tax=Olpidium bornovanus TaxID=278681 RepID=A0A8H7ZTR3_9FUNG|nr:MAG: hypothetical protein BJ554DRAFT_310 [Olpidium bornovanus]
MEGESAGASPARAGQDPQPRGKARPRGASPAPTGQRPARAGQVPPPRGKNRPRGASPAPAG